MNEFNLNDLVAEMQRVVRDLQKLLANAWGDRYYEGKPCVNGHGRQRYIANDQCVKCQRAAVAASKARGKQVRP